jgi:hypothetical protein
MNHKQKLMSHKMLQIEYNKLLITQKVLMKVCFYVKKTKTYRKIFVLVLWKNCEEFNKSNVCLSMAFINESESIRMFINLPSISNLIVVLSFPITVNNSLCCLYVHHKSFCVQLFIHFKWKFLKKFACLLITIWKIA